MRCLGSHPSFDCNFGTLARCRRNSQGLSRYSNVSRCEVAERVSKWAVSWTVTPRKGPIETSLAGGFPYCRTVLNKVLCLSTASWAWLFWCQTFKI